MSQKTLLSLQIRRFGIETANDILLDSRGEVEEVYECPVDSHNIHSARCVFLGFGENLSENFGCCYINIEVERRNALFKRIEKQRIYDFIPEFNALVLICFRLEILRVNAEVGGVAAVKLVNGIFIFESTRKPSPFSALP